MERYLYLGCFLIISAVIRLTLIAVMTIVGMKDIPVTRLFKIGLLIWSVAFLGTVTTALLGIKDSVMFVHNKSGLGFVIRSSLGMTHQCLAYFLYGFRRIMVCCI